MDLAFADPPFKMNPKGVCQGVRRALLVFCMSNGGDVAPHVAQALKLMDRIVTIASDPGSLVLDPFGGSGTTFVAAELNGRRWIGAELDCSSILERFDALDGDREHLTEIHRNKNVLFTQTDLDRIVTIAKAGRPLSTAYQLDSPPHGAIECPCPPL